MRWALLVGALLASGSVSLARTTVADYLALDPQVASREAAHVEFAAAHRRGVDCPPARDDAEPHVRCLLEALNGDRPIEMTGDGTLSSLLVGRRADPFSLVAALLLLHGDPMRLDAVVFGPRVLLAVHANRERYFDPTASGRAMTPGLAFATFGHEFMRAERADVDRFLGYYAGRLAVAASSEHLFRTAVERVPDSARLHYDFGAWLLAAGRLEEAKDQLTSSTRLGPDDIEAWMDRGAVLTKLDKLKPARKCYLQALRIDPRSKVAAERLRALDAEIAKRAAREQE